MAGQTQIDIDLRNELVKFIENLDLQGEEATQAQDLYWRLKPKRNRARKVPIVTTDGPIAQPIEYKNN